MDSAEPIKFQIVNQYGEDNEEELYHIYMYGRTEDDKSVLLITHFRPYFFVLLNGAHIDVFKSQITKAMGDMKDQLQSVTMVEREKFFGFTNHEKFKFARLVFSSSKAHKRAQYIVKNKLSKTTQKYDIYEGNIDPMLRFFHIQEIKTAGWVEVKNYKKVNDPISSCDYEITAKWKEILPNDNEVIAPIRIASFDIETQSADGGFPDPDDKRCYVAQISTVILRYGEKDPYLKHLISYGSCDPIDGATVECYDNEADVLDAWAKLIRREDVDIIVGYNIWMFDFWFMNVRALMCGATDFFYLSKLNEETSEMYEAQFSSGAYGDSDFKMLPTKGRLQLDLHVYIKREHKLSSFKLDNVAKHFLNDQKVDMEYKLLFQKLKESSSTRKEVAEYCIYDSVLPLRLIQKLVIIPNMLEMAKATWVPLGYLIERGQGIKVFSQLAYRTRQRGMLIITLKNGESMFETGTFEGATVLDAKVGAYMAHPITGLDFASLYPSIIRAENFCYNTLVIEDKYKNLPGIKYNIVNGYHWVQNEEGVIPEMCRRLKENRSKAKKDMAAAKKAGDMDMYAVYNGKQLAFKVSMNSIYGFPGASVGFLPCKPLSECTTFVGRGMIEHTKKKVLEWYPGSDVVYGDSVTEDSPVIIKKNGKMMVVEIKDLAKTYIKRDDGKEYGNISFMEVWTEKGWSKIKRVIRHKTSKRIFRVTTKCGCIDVTEDHSLIFENMKEATPMSVLPGEYLLTTNFPEGADTKKLFVQEKNVAYSKLRAMEYCLAIKSLGFNYTIEHDNQSYIIHTQKTPMYFNNIVVDKILLPKTTQYVYDLETENHHFHVGPGDIVVHNTDSVMVQFNTGDLVGKDAIKKSFELGEEAAERITKTFKEPNELEMEKVYYPYILCSKKRYAGLMYTEPDKPDYIDAKGIQLVRRDNPPFVKDISTQVLNEIMYNLDPIEAQRLVTDCAKNLLNNRIPIDQMVISKSLKRIAYDYTKGQSTKNKVERQKFNLLHDYASANQPHIHVAIKQEERLKGSGPKSGDRVPYVFVETKNPKDLQYLKAEDPVYAVKHKLKPDVVYYLNHSLISPMESLFKMFMDDPADLFIEPLQDYQKRKNKMVDIFEYIK